MRWNDGTWADWSRLLPPAKKHRVGFVIYD